MERFPLSEDISMHRFFANARRGDTLLLDAEDVHHALKVLRLQQGDAVTCYFDGCAYLCHISALHPQEGIMAIDRELPSAEPRIQITLFQGIPKSDKMDMIVQKAVELGCIRIVPVVMQRCVTRVDSGYEKKRERYLKIAREACKQSGRSRMVTVDSPISLGDITRYLPLDALLVPWENATAQGPLHFVQSHPDCRSLGILIGPEGGIDKSEMEALTALGALPLTLGPRILRTETAGLACISALMALYAEMEVSSR